MSCESTVRPPKPESKTPIGAGLGDVALIPRSVASGLVFEQHDAAVAQRVATGRGVELGAERSGEVALTAKSEVCRELGEVHRARGQAPCALGQALAEHVAVGRHAERAPEQQREMPWADADQRGQLRQPNVFTEPLPDVR